MKRLGVDELAERLVDQGDVRLAQQVMDVLGRAQHDPVERELQKIRARLNGHGIIRPHRCCGLGRDVLNAARLRFHRDANALTD